MAQRDATDAQLRKLKAIKKEFGRGCIRTYRVDARTGRMFVRVKAPGGEHTWWFDTRGDMIDKAYQPRLDSPLPVTADPATHTEGTLREPRGDTETGSESDSGFIRWADANPIQTNDH